MRRTFLHLFTPSLSLAPSLYLFYTSSGRISSCPHLIYSSAGTWAPTTEVTTNILMVTLSVHFLPSFIFTFQQHLTLWITLSIFYYFFPCLWDHFYSLLLGLFFLKLLPWLIFSPPLKYPYFLEFYSQLFCSSFCPCLILFILGFSQWCVGVSS